MRWVKGVAALVIPVLAAAAVLSLVMLWSGHPPGGLRAEGKERLTEDTLVERVKELSVHNRLHKVAWNRQILSIDLRWNSSQAMLLETLHDMKEIAEFAFERTPNVNQVLVRVLQHGESSRLLAAMDARREQWTEIEDEEVEAEALRAELERRADVLLTEVGKHHFTQPQ